MLASAVIRRLSQHRRATQQLPDVPSIKSACCRMLGSRASLAELPRPIASAFWVCTCGLRAWSSECFRCGSVRHSGDAESKSRAVKAAKPLDGPPKRKLSTIEAVAILRNYAIDVEAGKLSEVISVDLTVQERLSLVTRTFFKLHPRAARTIKLAGGYKIVAQDFSHLVTFENGSLTAPPISEQAKLKALQRKPVMLSEVFRKAGGEVLDFDRFDEFFGKDNKPTAVGIDTEGFHFDPPLLVQVCPLGSNKVFIEEPSKKGLSPALKELLDDDSIIKVFFDAGEDVKALDNATMRIADLQAEVLAPDCPWSGSWGPNNQPSLMDLAPYLISADGKALCRKDKSQTAKFWRVKARGRVSKAMREYAAGDAWVTIHAWDRLQRKKKGLEWVGLW